MRFGCTRALIGLLMTVMLGSTRLAADLIPPGHKAVSHQLVFVDSPQLQTHRLIALPVRGFGGHEEIQPDRPFRFSSKYGTRLYVVPEDFVPPEEVHAGAPLPFPSCEVPIGCITSVPMLSPIASIRSTCKLVAVAEDAIEVELVNHVELGSDGQPASLLKNGLPLLGIAAAGLVGCCLVWRRVRASKSKQVVETQN